MAEVFLSYRVVAMLAGPTDSFKCCHRRPGHSCCYGVKQGLDLTGHACPPDRLSGILCGDPNRLGSGGLSPTHVEDGILRMLAKKLRFQL